MTQLESPGGLRDIGEEAKPPYAVLPDPAALFLGGSQRLRALAPGHMLQSYLNFAAGVTEAQHAAQASLPEPVLPSASRIREAQESGLPPLSRSTFEPREAEQAALSRLLDGLRQYRMTEEASTAIGALAAASAERRRHLMSSALKTAPVEDTAGRVFILAGLQIVFARLAAKLTAKDLRPVADSVCPACGSPPMSSSVVGWPKAHNSRFCACSLCGTMWNVVRIKCVLCGSTEGIAYHSIEGQPEHVKAETCGKCRRYVKILYQIKDHMLDALSDDVASLDLDMRLAQEGWERGGDNLFLLGY
jgi:FdhE protein